MLPTLRRDHRTALDEQEFSERFGLEQLAKG
jgi:hypothetical protein